MSRVPFYCSMLRNGRADGAAHPAMVAERAGACLIDNRDGLPYVSVEWAIGELIQRARRRYRWATRPTASKPSWTRMHTNPTAFF